LKADNVPDQLRIEVKDISMEIFRDDLEKLRLILQIAQLKIDQLILSF